jgi:hypothetical protein
MWISRLWNSFGIIETLEDGRLRLKHVMREGVIGVVAFLRELYCVSRHAVILILFSKRLISWCWSHDVGWNWPGKQCKMIWQVFWLHSWYNATVWHGIKTFTVWWNLRCAIQSFSFVKFFILIIICYGFSATNVFVVMLEVGKDKANCLCNRNI